MNISRLDGIKLLKALNPPTRLRKYSFFCLFKMDSMRLPALLFATFLAVVSAVAAVLVMFLLRSSLWSSLMSSSKPSKETSLCYVIFFMILFYEKK